jgi:hypothetical protein
MAKIPSIIRNNIDNYVKSGYLPGGFCEAVLCDKLQEAVERGDLECRKALSEIALYVKKNVPPEARGSMDVLTGWAAVLRKRKTDPRND